MKIFVFVYIRRWGGLVAQGIGGFYRSCFGTQNRNDNRNSVGSRGVYCTCLGTQNRNGVRSYCTCLSTRNRNGTAGRIWREIVKDGRKWKKYVEYCKGKVFVCGQYMGAIDFYTVLTYNRFRIINNNCKKFLLKEKYENRPSCLKGRFFGVLRCQLTEQGSIPALKPFARSGKK